MFLASLFPIGNFCSSSLKVFDYLQNNKINTRLIHKYKQIITTERNNYGIFNGFNFQSQ